MDDKLLFIYRAYLLNLCVAQAIRKALFDDRRLTSTVISAQELIDYQLDAIFDAVYGRMLMEPEEQINARWREAMEFIATVTERI